MRTLQVLLPHSSYEIAIGRQLLPRAGSLVRQVYSGRRAAVVADENVWQLYGQTLCTALHSQGIEPLPVVVPAGEASKQLSRLDQVYQAFAEAGLTRSELIIAFGGGVVGDLAGFAAATYMRGMPYVQLPTTLLAQVDSSVGGKTAVNLPQGKNLVGAFWQPRLVVADTHLLETLNDREFACGMAEVIKYGAIASQPLLEQLQRADGRAGIMQSIEEVVYHCCDIKRSIVQEDERDTGRRMLLNFGHTFGHAIERLGGFSQLNHGEAVGLGMLLAAKAGQTLGISPADCYPPLQQLLERFGLPVEQPFTLLELLPLLALDKKAGQDSLQLILLKELGCAKIHPISLQALAQLMERGQ